MDHEDEDYIFWVDSGISLLGGLIVRANFVRVNFVRATIVRATTRNAATQSDPGIWRQPTAQVHLHPEFRLHRPASG